MNEMTRPGAQQGRCSACTGEKGEGGGGWNNPSLGCVGREKIHCKWKKVVSVGEGEKSSGGKKKQRLSRFQATNSPTKKGFREDKSDSQEIGLEKEKSGERKAKVG
jgi:hypothetical protein